MITERRWSLCWLNSTISDHQFDPLPSWTLTTTTSPWKKKPFSQLGRSCFSEQPQPLQVPMLPWWEVSIVRVLRKAPRYHPECCGTNGLAWDRLYLLRSTSTSWRLQPQVRPSCSRPSLLWLARWPSTDTLLTRPLRGHRRTPAWEMIGTPRTALLRTYVFVIFGVTQYYVKCKVM